MYKRIILPLLFRFDAETIHHTVTSLLKFAFAIPGISAISRKLFVLSDPRLERTVFGLTFPNPVGMAAGFDKNAELVSELSDLGFGFVEIGTVTPRPQPGNPRPRLFRLKADGGLINRMGFNNKGVGPAAERLRDFKRNRGNRRVIVGGNIGKNKDTPNENALSDYLTGFQELFDAVDYFVVNVSSPNTPGLRDLQEREPLTRLLTALQTENHRRLNPKPILLKIAPDLTNGQLDDIIAIVTDTGIAGIIATNTTINRDGLATDPATVAQIGAGGVSGRPLRERATEVIRYLHQQSGGAFPIIGVGGIFSAADAQEKLLAGASLVQVYTSFIYEGPGLAIQINQALLAESVTQPGLETRSANRS
ncbi:quinone-dependent dihydroorotate dehydrogenase [Spirosoma taeanense]|uniref:Dihydroorotate dehydrogenase (quinone) n=1 Tax=Spirosoma taeanense TaxID=2735870 RepID=A0A6M5Y2H6_9BACT|nr:quinone-dependent dihydroorotate dehydrogenase [Spirosoma taeanense]QJW87989.1 quinone-dependent dihydroorotate dehydrogenase [Spirosoma taeanense]